MSLKIGTCSWNYDSWAGLVYKSKAARSADYLKQYSELYSTAEIDSWFYHIPAAEEVLEYKNNVGNGFSFTCKAPQTLTLTHLRKKENPANLDFLSNEYFALFANAISPLVPQIDAVMLQFEYLNKQKMPSLQEFCKKLNEFRHQIPLAIPIAAEIRNGNYIKEEYFQFLKESGIIPVLVEKQYMPPVTQVFETFEEFIGEKVIFRLLGGDRREIEQITGDAWDTVVLPKQSTVEIAKLVKRISKGRQVIVNVNNHFEGSAPHSINTMLKIIED
ncbi:MAG: DUF72 domain-containing protein [Spirochaetales bacterium]|nr:DUF72 domain-containing protein [Spirochaetales bacterium]